MLETRLKQLDEKFEKARTQTIDQPNETSMRTIQEPRSSYGQAGPEIYKLAEFIKAIL